MKKLIPKLVYCDIFQITPDCLLKRGVKAMLIDLDGTMASRHAPKPDKKLRGFLQQFMKAGIKVLVLSNNNEQRVSEFCENLDVYHISRARKPLKSGFLAAQKIIDAPFAQMAVVGDQIFTDVYGGNRLGSLTIYVQSIDQEDFIIKLRYQFERRFVRMGENFMRRLER